MSARVQTPQMAHMMRMVSSTGNNAKTLNLIRPLENVGIGIQALSRYCENRTMRTIVLYVKYLQELIKLFRTLQPLPSASKH